MIEAKPSIQKLHRIKDLGINRTNFVRMDKNERSTAFSDTVFQEMMSNISSELLPIYPDQRPLYEKLSVFHGVEENWKMVRYAEIGHIETAEMRAEILSFLEIHL